MPSSCFIIAEAGVNHNGDADHALRLVDAAAETGADAVKFQTFKAATLASVSGPDQKASLEPIPFRAMVESIRAIEAALGSGEKTPGAGELRTATVARRS